MKPLAPWLQAQLLLLVQRPGHALLLQGPSGLGQYELGLSLAGAWLCHAPTEHGACGVCPSCHGIAVRAHADLVVLMPEVDMIELQWPLPEKSLKDIEDKKRKPSREIRVEAMRDMLSFSQTTSAGARGKVVFIYPAERMNHITANTLLKTLEEPPGDTRFILACQAAQELLPTVRSRCQNHAMAWPATDQATRWLVQQSVPADDAQVLLQAAGGRPDDALMLFQSGIKASTWKSLPVQVSKGDGSVLADHPPAVVLSFLQKICHDMLSTKTGGAPRFFNLNDLPRTGQFDNLSAWSRELMMMAKTVDHPYQPGLLLEAWVSRAQRALSA